MKHRIRLFSLVSVVLAGSVTGGSCSDGPRSADADAFALVVRDIAKSAPSPLRVNPIGHDGAMDSALASERQAVLRALAMLSVADVDHGQCPGLTSPFSHADDLKQCPPTDMTLAVVGALRRGVDPAATSEAPATSPDPNAEYSILVNLFELGPRGSTGASYLYTFRFRDRRAFLEQRVQIGMP